MFVQLYGFTDPADVDAVAGLGLDHLGVVLDEGFGTWDGVTLPVARAMARAIDDGTRLVSLSQHTTADDVCRTVDLLPPAIVHLVRVAGAMPPGEVAELGRRLAPVEIMVTVPVGPPGRPGADARDLARRYGPVADYLLLDTVSPATGIPGATGLVHDWATSAAICAEAAVPVILAGGLGPDNVAEAIGRVGPDGVDSETRTSRTDDRRRKDPELVRRFVAAARAAEPGPRPER